MASVNIFLRNGDVLGVGAAIEQAVVIYRALLSEAENEFIDLGMLGDNFPRVAIRIADIEVLFLNPFDAETTFYHSAANRNALNVFAVQDEMGKRAATTPK